MSDTRRDAAAKRTRMNTPLLLSDIHIGRKRFSCHAYGRKQIVHTSV